MGIGRLSAHLAKHRQLLYFSSLLLLLVVASFGVLEQFPGGDSVRRNTEGYALAILVPAFWHVAAASSSSDSRSETLLTKRFLFAIIIGVLATQRGIVATIGADPPDGFTTLSEAFIATLGVATYLLWSRRMSHDQVSAEPGVLVRPLAQRCVYYFAALGLLLISLHDAAPHIVGGGTVEWFQRNDEALAALIVLPLYFDLIYLRSRTRTIGWIVLVVLFPLAVQAGLVSPERFAGWSERVTETFIAAALIAAYFQWVVDEEDWG